MDDLRKEFELDDASGTAPVGNDAAVLGDAAVADTNGIGCHGGVELSKAAARAAGQGELMDRFEADYPKGPHDQPQSMCPAFG